MTATRRIVSAIALVGLGIAATLLVQHLHGDETRPATSGTPTTTPPADCEASDLRVEWTAPEGAAGTLVGGLVLSPREGIQCRMAGGVGIRATEASTGRVLDSAVALTSTGGYQAPIVIDGQHSAHVIVFLGPTSALPCPPEMRLPVTALTITPPGNGVAPGPGSVTISLPNGLSADWMPCGVIRADTVDLVPATPAWIASS